MKNFKNVNLDARTRIYFIQTQLNHQQQHDNQNHIHILLAGIVGPYYRICWAHDATNTSANDT